MPRLPDHGWKEVITVLEQLGFEYERHTSRNHLAYVKKGIPRPVIIPKYSTISKFIIKNIIRGGLIDQQEYIEILTGIKGKAKKRR